MSFLIDPFRFGVFGVNYLTPSIDQTSARHGTVGAHLHTITAPSSGDHIIAVGLSTDGSGFDTPSGFTVVYSKAIATWNNGFELSIDVFVKQSDGSETHVPLIPGGLTSSLDATVSFVLVVSDLQDVSNPLDVTGEDDVTPGSGTSLTLTLSSATSQPTSLVTAFAVARDDDIDANFSFSNLSDSDDGWDEQNNPIGSAFDLTGFHAADVKTESAAHSSVFSYSSGGAEELMGVILAWNAKAA